MWNPLSMCSFITQASMVAQTVKNSPAIQETWVRSLGWEDPLEKGTATYSSILAWRIPGTEEPGGLQYIRSQRVRHDWATFTYSFITQQQKTNTITNTSGIQFWVVINLLSLRTLWGGHLPSLFYRWGNQDTEHLVSSYPNSRWWTGRPGVLQSMRSQRIRHNRMTELNWTIHFFCFFFW